jgi:hypothetical protein
MSLYGDKGLLGVPDGHRLLAADLGDPTVGVVGACSVVGGCFGAAGSVVVVVGAGAGRGVERGERLGHEGVDEPVVVLAGCDAPAIATTRAADLWPTV